MPENSQNPIRIETFQPKKRSVFSNILMVSAGLLVFGFSGDIMISHHLPAGINLPSIGILLSVGLIFLGIRNLIPKRQNG